MARPEEVLRGFVEESRHLTTNLNTVASDMIRDRSLVQKLDDDPSYFTRTYALSDAELAALRARNQYWQALGAPGRRHEG